MIVMQLSQAFWRDGVKVLRCCICRNSHCLLTHSSLLGRECCNWHSVCMQHVYNKQLPRGSRNKWICPKYTQWRLRAKTRRFHFPWILEVVFSGVPQSTWIKTHTGMLLFKALFFAKLALPNNTFWLHMAINAYYLVPNCAWSNNTLKEMSWA
jgi:hypothetical protein